MSMKNFTVTPAEIEPTTFRFVTQQFNHCATAVPSVTNGTGYFAQNVVEYLLPSLHDTGRYMTGQTLEYVSSSVLIANP